MLTLAVSSGSTRDAVNETAATTVLSCLYVHLLFILPGLDEFSGYSRYRIKLQFLPSPLTPSDQITPPNVAMEIILISSNKNSFNKSCSFKSLIPRHNAFLWWELLSLFPCIEFSFFNRHLLVFQIAVLLPFQYFVHILANNILTT